MKAAEASPMSLMDLRTLETIKGLKTLSSKWPLEPPMETATWLPITWAATIVMASHWVGLTLPGMINCIVIMDSSHMIRLFLCPTWPSSLNSDFIWPNSFVLSGQFLELPNFLTLSLITSSSWLVLLEINLIWVALWKQRAWLIRQTSNGLFYFG